MDNMLIPPVISRDYYSIRCLALRGLSCASGVQKVSKFSGENGATKILKQNEIAYKILKIC